MYAHLDRRERNMPSIEIKHRIQYLSIIMDGMDQDKTDLPHIISNPKSIAGC